jgi:hypothetical protein
MGHRPVHHRGRRDARTLLKALAVLACATGRLPAQDGGGQGFIGFQQYYLSSGSQRVANISGLNLSYTQFIPDVGLFSASLSPAMSNDSFRTGEDYLRLTGAPWEGQHWNVTGGDFHLPSQILQVPFSNLYYPEIAARGILVEARHGGRSVGVFYGTETIANTPRVVLRIPVPQSVFGVYVRQQIGERLRVGLRFLHFSTNLAALQSTPTLITQATLFRTSSSIGLDALYTVAAPFKLYAEATWSAGQQEGPGQNSRNVPVSTLVGSLFDSRFLRFRANYTLQSASYLPLLGYYLGDREGPYAEVNIHPVTRLEIYGSASEYHNNVAANPVLAEFRTATASAGATLQLPWRISINGQATVLDLWSRTASANPWDKTTSKQQTATISRTFTHHSLFVTARGFQEISAISPQRQSSADLQDIVRTRHLLMGGGVRLQRLIEGDTRNTLFYHGLAQFNAGPFSAYADVEIGSDLVNRTLLATNTINTSLIGASVSLGRNWEFQGEAYRNNLVAELNPQSIFVLQGQGVFVPGSLATLNQWSLYFRISRRFHWGKAGDAGDIGLYALAKAPLKGWIEGFVKQQTDEGNLPAEGIIVSLDQDRTVTTDADGRYRFAEVPEGIHAVGLSMEELLADFDPGPDNRHMVAVHADRPSRSDLDVVPLVTVPGKLTGPADVPLEEVVIRIAPAGRYTTPDAAGDFYFYNLHEGKYTITLDEKTLPEFAVLTTPGSVETVAAPGAAANPVTFRFEVHEPQKPVRKVLKESAAPTPAPQAGALGIPQPVEPVHENDVPQRLAVSPTVERPVIALVLPPVAVPPPRSAKDSRSETAQKHNLKGRQLTAARRYRQAIAELTEAIRLEPDFALAYNARGFAHYLAHDYAAAIADLSHAIRLNPGYGGAYKIRSVVRKAAGNLAGSAADAQRAAELAHSGSTSRSK